MIACSRTLLALLTVAFIASSLSVAGASPTMVRLGYATCSACHLAPEGAGLLSDYGKGIDQAQSLSAGEYQPGDNPDRWFQYDARALTSVYAMTPSELGRRPAPPQWLRARLRNSVALGSRNRVATVMRIGSPTGPVSELFHSAPSLNWTGAWEHRTAKTVMLSVARDRLPRGIELGETRTILQEGGDADPYPTQLRAFISSDRFRITGYAYGPGSSDAHERGMYGMGALGEIPILENHLVLGASIRRGRSDVDTHDTVGAYARLGFGMWGVLAEHDLSREEKTPAVAAKRYAGYTQFFVAAREWLVASLISEYAVERGGAPARTFRWRPELQARLSPYMTITASASQDTKRPGDDTGHSYLVQLAFKTVQ